MVARFFRIPVSPQSRRSVELPLLEKTPTDFGVSRPVGNVIESASSNNNISQNSQNVNKKENIFLLGVEGPIPKRPYKKMFFNMCEKPPARHLLVWGGPEVTPLETVLPTIVYHKPPKIAILLMKIFRKMLQM